MLTAEEYRQSIRDGRASYLEGRRIDDPVTHPLLRVSVDWVASTYERTCAADPGARNPIFDLPATPAELDEQMNFLIEADVTAASTAGCMALGGVAARLAEADPSYRERLERFLQRCRTEDLRVAAAVEDGGELRVVRRSDDGIVLQGAKRHVLGAAVVHELCVVPSGEVSEAHSDRAVACAVPVDAPGLKIISITTAPRAEDPRHFPISRERSIPDCTVLFDEVFVPWDRVFLDGEVAYSAALAEALGTWERARAAATLADEAELIFGLAQTIVEMNGVPDATHILDKLSKMAVWASMCRAGWTAALVHATTNEAGAVVPADNHVYATMAYGRSLFNEMVSYLHDVSGALLLTCPTVADYENPETHGYMEKYLRTMDGVTGEDRMRIFHVIRDLTADHYGGWAKINNQMVGGGLHSQRMAALRTFPKDAAKARARRVAGISESGEGQSS
jgi:4-hydroxybutyryl-CoA dehydratase/vinylacetyl-CoA-Delta-isomerase